MQKWLDLVAIAESVNYNDDCDAIVWSFADSNSFSVQVVYKTISFRGVQPVYTPNIWGLNVPPRIHIFYGSSPITKLLPELTWLREDMWKMCLACFVMNLKQLTTYSLIVV